MLDFLHLPNISNDFTSMVIAGIVLLVILFVIIKFIKIGLKIAIVLGILGFVLYYFKIL